MLLVSHATREDYVPEKNIVSFQKKPKSPTFAISFPSNICPGSVPFQ